MKNIKILFLFICLSYGISSAEELYKEETTTLSYQGVPLTIYARYTLQDKTKNCSVRNILDGKGTTIWCSRKLEETYDGQKPSVEIRFGREVYIDTISIKTGCGKSQQGTITFLGIEKTISKERIFDFTEHYKLKSEPIAQSVDLRRTTPFKNIYDLFPAKALRLEIFDVYANAEEACVAELKMPLREALNYTPDYSWKEVKAYITTNADWWKGESGWDFRKRDTKEIQFRNQSHFTALTYYAMSGNKEAARLFLRHVPIGAADSAVMADYYKPLMREWLKQKKIHYEE